ncbi:unnamed protein product [Absidia cylindrospora]
MTSFGVSTIQYHRNSRSTIRDIYLREPITLTHMNSKIRRWRTLNLRDPYVFSDHRQLKAEQHGMEKESGLQWWLWTMICMQDKGFLTDDSPSCIFIFVNAWKK